MCNGPTRNLKPPQFIKVAPQINVDYFGRKHCSCGSAFPLPHTTILAFWEAAVILSIDQITGKDHITVS